MCCREAHNKSLVTIYHAGTQMCPVKGRQIALLDACFNSSWAYFSIDNCQNQSSSALSLPTTGVATTSSSTSVTTITNIAATGSSSPDHTNVGAIAGGVVGGVVGLVLMLVLLWFLWMQRRRQQRGPESSSHYISGLRMSELEAPRMAYQMSTPDAASSKAPPSELPDPTSLPAELPETSRGL